MPERRIGRYRLYDEIASGGMAVVHLGRLAGAGGFARTVAIKRLHPHLATDPDVVSMLLDEARLAARIRHPNVAPIFDVVVEKGDVALVLEYVEGESLSHLLIKALGNGERVPVRVALAIACGALRGLGAAHEATADDGTALALVHRDVSPQNILVGVDGNARVIDFGVAKATARLQTTHDGQLKGKFGYMAPEQLTMAPLDARTDIYAAGIVLWEALAGRRLFDATELAAVLRRTTNARFEPPSRYNPEVGPALDALVLRALALRREDRFPSATAMAQAIAGSGPIALPDEVGAWVRHVGGEDLVRRQARVAAVESGHAGDHDVGRGASAEVATAVGTTAPGVASRRKPAGRGRIPLFLVAGGGALFLAFASGARFSRAPAAQAAAPSGIPATPAIAAATSDPDPATSSAPGPTLSEAPDAPPQVTPSAPATVPASAAVRHRPSGRPPPSRASAAPRPSSEVPSYCSQRKLAFTVGPDGIERPRPECL